MQVPPGQASPLPGSPLEPRRVVGPDMGVKAAGGIRNAADLRAMVAAGATRVGASAGVKILAEAQEQAPTAPPAAAGDALPEDLPHLSVRCRHCDGEWGIGRPT